MPADMDITLIETMPLGAVDEDRTDQFLSLQAVRQELESFWTLNDSPERSGGPARYVRIAETGGRLGFITPLTHNFCDTLQSRAPDLHRHAVHVPGPGSGRGPARALRASPARRFAQRRHRSRHGGQAQGA